MDLKRFENIYFIGLGGIGMSALARYFLLEGKKVAGYDRTATTLTAQLEAEGMQLHFTDSIDKVPQDFGKENTLVVYTPAIPKDHGELKHFKNNGFKLKKRSEVLGAITDGHFLAAVAGTHGKTTTSSILAHILKCSSKGCTAFLGGITKNYNSNFVHTADSKNMVTEADEYDRSFLALTPDVAIITSMDADHLDIYGTGDALTKSFFDFANNIKPNGTLIYKQGLNFPDYNGNSYNYSLSGDTDFHASNIEVVEGRYVFDLSSPLGNWKQISFSYPGKHNVENAIAAIAVAQIMGITEAEVKEALYSFTGIKRRFDYQLHNQELVFIDDYAHHPAELKTCIQSVKDLFPMKEITGVFQPHLFSRTRDFADGFAASLSLLDELVMLPIYPAREEPIPGVTSEMILDMVDLERKSMSTKDDIVNDLASKDIEVLLTLGAGDIDTTVEPIRKMLLDKLSMAY